MIYMHKDFIKRGYKDYHIKKLIELGKLHYIKKGVYSTTLEINYFEYIAKKHPNAIITLWTAGYCYGFMKENKKIYAVATKQKDRKIHDNKIKQTFMTDDLYEVGLCYIKFQGINIKIFDLERLLIEVVRNKTNVSYEMYQEMIASYSKVKNLINKRKLNEYISHFQDKKIKERIIREVYNGELIEK